MRACYFIQTHTNPGQIHRLVRTLKRSSPDAFVLIGHDVSGVNLDLSPVADLAGVDHFAVNGPLNRGGLSVLAPYFEAIEWIARRDLRFDWLIYLSGQDYPTLPLDQAEAFLAGSGRDGFISHHDIRSEAGWWADPRRGSRRYLYRYRPVSRLVGRPLRVLNSVQALFHVHTTYGMRLGVRARPSPFSDAFRCYVGDQWHALSRPCVEYLRRALKEQAELIDYFGHTICPCEAVVQTLLVNSGRFDLANDSLRFVDFAGRRDGRPRVLTAADFTTITSGTYHFARKVDTRVNVRLLDLLEDLVLRGRGPRELGESLVPAPGAITTVRSES